LIPATAQENPAQPEFLLLKPPPTARRCRKSCCGRQTVSQPPLFSVSLNGASYFNRDQAIDIV
jgi:hypothetical protein